VAAGVGPALSGGIIHFFDEIAGLHGWQWLFLLEGIPACLLGIGAYFYLDDGPTHARWLKQYEKQAIEEDLAEERIAKSQGEEYTIRDLIKDPRIYVLGLIGSSIYVSSSTVQYWGPTILYDAGITQIPNIGTLLMLPSAVGVVVMIAVSRHSDKKKERRWHYAIPIFISSIALLVLSMPGLHGSVALIGLTVVTAGTYAASAILGSIPAIYLSESTKAIGIAMCHTISGIGGMIAPVMMGVLHDKSGNLSFGLQVNAMIVVVAGLMLLFTFSANKIRESSSDKL
jgi:sugar phosphate permease